MLNPYQNVDWGNVQHVISCAHWHCYGNVERFWAIYNTGLQHFALTHYQPSFVTYPLDDNVHFKLDSDDVPKDIIQSPNTEMPRMSNGNNMHIGTLGSLYQNAGHDWNVDVDGRLLSWQEIFDNVLEDLQYNDGGGVIINHPYRTGLSVDTVIERLKYDDRVLGIEFINHRSERDYGGTGYIFDYWDDISSRGIRCFGFCGTDEHTPPPNYIEGTDMRERNYGLGRNIVLTENYDSHAVLKSYRNGEFYGAFFGDRIKFTRIEVVGNEFIVETDDAARIDFVSYSIKNRKRVKNDVVTVYGSEASFVVEDSHIFVRAVAYEVDEDNPYEQPIKYEKIYTQPLLLKTEQEVRRLAPEDNKKKRILLMR